MALQKQNVLVPLDNGLDTKVDPKQAALGFLRVSENIVYERVKEFKKRNGYSLVTRDIVKQGQVENIKCIDSYKRELLAYTDSEMYAFSHILNKWVLRGPIYPIFTDTYPIIKNANSQEKMSSWITENIMISAWEDSSGGVRYSVQDLDNKNFLTSNVLLDINGKRPEVTTITNTVFIFYVDGTALKYKTFKITEPNDLSAAVTVLNNVDPVNPLLDVEFIGGKIFIAFNSSVVGSKLGLLSIDEAEMPTSVLNITGSDASKALTLWGDSLGRVFIGYSDGTDVRYVVYSNNLLAQLRVPTVIEAIANVTNISFSQDSSNVYQAFYEVAQAGTSNNFVKKNSTPLSGPVGTPKVFARSVGLGAKVFKYNDRIFVPTVFESGLQSTYFLMDELGNIVTKYYNQTAAGAITHGVLNSSFVFKDAAIVPAIIVSRVASDNGVFFSTKGAGYAELDFTPDFCYSSALLSENLHICGGLLRMYDGANLVEHGFNVFPEGIRVVGPIPTTVAKSQTGVIGVSEVQLIKFSAVPTSGSYTLTLGAETTSPLAYNASNASIKSALEAFTALTTVTVTGNYTVGLTITINSPQQNIGLITVTNNNLITENITITVQTQTNGVAPVKEIAFLDYNLVPDAGNFQINVDGNVTANIEFNASNAAIKAALEALPNITTVTVAGSFTLGHTITIDAPIKSFPTFIIATNTLTSSGNPVVIYPAVNQEGIDGVSEVQQLTFSLLPQAGNYTISNGTHTTGLLAFNANNATIEAALEALPSITAATVTGSYASGITITVDAPQQNFPTFTTPTNTLTNSTGTAITAITTVVTEGAAQTQDVQVITFEFTPTAGSFKIQLGSEVTTAINYSMGSADVKAALEALTAITTVTVTGSFSAGFTVTFVNPPAVIPIMQVVENSLGVAPVTAGSLTDGNRGYVAVYRWIDNTGRTHRSSPSLPSLNFALAGGTNTQSTTVRVPTLRLTDKEDVVIELYRTEAAGESFYLAATVRNDKTVDFVDIVDTISDANLISQELLYTTGGILENVAAPACRLVTALPDRLVVVGDLPNRVLWSKTTGEGSPVEFTDIIYRDVLEQYGEISSLVAMEDKTIIFTKDATFYVAGDGPNNTGQQDTFTSTEIVSTDIGCLDTRSAIYTSIGVMFKSRKGIWLLSKAFSIEYIGARVENFNNQTITSAQIIGELNQIRFLTSSNIALVLNYNLDKWGTFDNHGGLSSVVIENDYYYLRENGEIFKEDRTLFSDADSAIKLKFETGWLSFADMQGFQRIHYALLLCSYFSPHKLRIKVAYDFVDAWVQEQIIDPLDFLSDSRYGQGSPYGQDPLYGNQGNLYQVRVFMERQKCQAIKISIEDLQDSPSQGLSFSALNLVVSVKGTENKVSASNSFGVK